MKLGNEWFSKSNDSYLLHYHKPNILLLLKMIDNTSDEVTETESESENDTSTICKSFFKKTRKGAIIRLVREKYIRNDIDCGFLHGLIPLSIDKLMNIILSNINQHILIIDTNIALHQIDVLEFPCEGTQVVILLQTVLQEVKHRNLSVYNRICKLLNDESRLYIFFPNEACVSTLVLRRQKESINDSNDRSIRHVTQYFDYLIEKNSSSEGSENELNINIPKVILISNDVDNRKLAQKEDIIAMSLKDYINKYLNKFTELYDLLSADVISDTNHISQEIKSIYQSHLTTSELMEGVRQKKFFKGTLRSKANSWSECYVVIHSGENEARQSIDVIGKLNVNRALDGDVVIVELYPNENEYQNDDEDIKEVKKREDEQKLVIISENVEATEEMNEVVDVSNSNSKTKKRFGRVVGVFRRNWRQYAGSIDKTPIANLTNLSNNKTSDEENLSSYLFYPVDLRLPPILISTRRQEELLNKRLLVAIDHWDIYSNYPQGHYVRVLGNDGEKDAETKVLLHEFDVPSNDFSADVMSCLPSSSWSITEDLVSQRIDLRHLPIVSIDPPSCKDIDDALHCIILPNGNIQAGVHIADVTFFVHPDTPLDKEASHRSTSTYLVDRRLDMLPSYLTTDLCSLRSQEDHLAFSVLWEIDSKTLEIIDVEFCKSVIHSVASFSYDQAQIILDANEKGNVSDVDIITQLGTIGAGGNRISFNKTIMNSIVLLNKLARKFRSHRIEQGALTLASPEVRFKLDESENANPTDISTYVLKEANALVEEWMLLANITVSKKILRHFPTLCVLRRHQPPSREQFEPLIQAALAVGVHLDISSSKALADSLDMAIRPEDPYFNKLLRILSTRCMMPAQYFCSGEIAKELWHHYGLAAPVYTHFTSPIRRYADIVVHRLLAAAIGVTSLPASYTERIKQQELCTHMNRRHRAAQYASRASVNLYTLLFFK